MSSRVTVAVSTVASPPPAPKTVTGKLFITGAVAAGKAAGVQRISGMTEFRDLYGERATANAALHDALQSFFAEGGSQAYVVAGQAPPEGDWSAYLDQFVADLGPGAVAIAGIGSAAAQHVGAHCLATGRLGLICGPDGQSAADAVTAVGVASGEDGADHMVYAWPWVSIPGLADPIEPIGFAAGVRARAHSSKFGPAQSPMAADFGTSRFVDGIEASGAVTDAEFRTLDDGKVSVVRIVAGKLRQYGWRVISNPAGDLSGNLGGGEKRDLINAIIWEASQIGEKWVGQVIDGRGVALGAFAGDLTGMLANYAATGSLFARVDDDGTVLDGGYAVNVGPDVNPPASLAAKQLNAQIGVRLSPTAEWVTITIAATDAAGSI